MNSYDYGDAAIRVFHMAHRFLFEYGIRWLPVDIIGLAQKNWKFKWAHDLAYEIGESNEYICRHVCLSSDGATFYDSETEEYETVLNAEVASQKRVVWSCAHEVGHIFLGHFIEYGASCLAKEKMPTELYARLEFEADLFAGEVLASKWLMRDIDIVSEEDIALICGISDAAALALYRKATADYYYMPANAVLTRQNFSTYLKEITVCQNAANLAETHIGDVNRFARLNHPKNKLPTPKPKFIRKSGNCPYCDSFFNAADAPNFCARCGSPLNPGLPSADAPCGHINPKESAYCEKCGNRVFRIRQGFCFDECEL